MRVLALFAVLLALPAMAHHHDDADPSDTPAVMDRLDVGEQLSAMDASLAEAMSRARGRPVALQSLRRARVQLRRLQEQLNGAPTPGEWWRSQNNPDEFYLEGARGQEREGEGERLVVNPIYPQPQPPPPGYITAPPPQPVLRPMSNDAFTGLMQALGREPFPRNRLMVLNQAVGSQYFLTAQVRALLERFEFPRDRLVAARTLKPRTLDRENAYQLYSLFDFPNDKAELQRIFAQ